MDETLFPHLCAAPAPGFATLADQAAAAEAWETPRWAIAAILDVEIMTAAILDPCCGAGALTVAAEDYGYEVLAMDLYDWGFSARTGVDFLTLKTADLPERFQGGDFTVLMNPPFSRACEFVDRAHALGARKIVCFQRLAWRESGRRRAWWDARPPARVWLCGDRAHTWLFTIPPQDRKGGRFMPTAWFVWERGHKGAEIGGTIWRNKS
ncbi:type I restriction-modification system subunit M [Varunaivibrio sulfuroxidans]|uniref:Methyltransferase n=1 Tax=Varunaivibrio sulfuroxidans TaxID=1773489 RepID=A0A4R3JBT9_9PROT|nr:type I restriction-modification system subunit M [Varunaivibrio sulfuroxidans]TCS62566.1 hypothetical protein EDD55_105112 [Varunaivibrio sulfuroxidans]WES30765.1 type I restriction-modification system subunit M [Varunaivibrio sulfuroxidans]